MAKTIAAIATAMAPAGIGVIRISGEGARQVASRVFRSKQKSLLTMPGYTAVFGTVFDASGSVDQAVATVFAAPHSYTGEDVVELSCHGGLYLLQRVLRAVLSAGAALAEPGEFTKRAFLNGKIDLAQAEGVMELISAQGEEAARSALLLHDGVISQRIEEIRGTLISLSAHMAAWVDYPEEDIPELTDTHLLRQLRETRQQLEDMLRQFEMGKLIREGIETVIAGKPNVGKSTLMNLLSGSERSIVTSIAGTTRDVVEETVRVEDMLLRLADTAGFRDTDDPVEQLGVERAKRKMRSAQLVIVVFDGSTQLSEEDWQLMSELGNRTSLAVVNKMDLPMQADLEAIRQRFEHVVLLSAKQQEDYHEFAKKLKTMFHLDSFHPSDGFLSTERQRDCCLRAAELLQEAIQGLEWAVTLDAVNVCVDNAIDALLELTGEKASVKIVDAVFSNFCLGK